MKKYSSLIILVTLLLPLTIGCNQKAIYKFPDTEIVFEANKKDNPLIGFVNSDGSHREEKNIGSYVEMPVWSEENETIYFQEPLGDYAVRSWMRGFPSFWEDGKRVRHCSALSGNPIYPIPNSNDVLVSPVISIIRIDQRTCKEREVYVEYTEPFNPPAIGGYTVSRDGKYILFTEVNNSKFTIKVLDLNTNIISDIGEGGINPEFSPDGNWIAYTGIDGIYVMGRDGKLKQKIVEGNFQDQGLSMVQFDYRSPAPRWSPDGKWLVYHKCRQPSTSFCMKIEDYSIYKVRISDGKDIKILDGGLYPYWRLK